MKKILLALTATTLLLTGISCKSADKKADEIAADFCNCLSGLEKKLSAATKKIVADAAVAADPMKSIQDNMIALGEEEGKKIGEEMESVGEMEDENSETGRCIKNVEKKYKDAYTMNEEKTVQKIIKELEAKPGCSFTASLMKLGLKMKGKPGFE